MTTEKYNSTKIPMLLSAEDDSGANINIISLVDAKRISLELNLSILQYSQPKQIDFTKEGSKSFAYQCIVTNNGAVGNIDIVEDIAENLCSVSLITANGYYVLFTRDRVLPHRSFFDSGLK